MKVQTLDLLKVCARSLWLQGLWTVQRGQNLGCVFSLWPVFNRLYPRAQDRAPAACAHAAYFSTHPYTAGVILGVVAGLEEERAQSSRPGLDAVLAARTAMSGPMAALGEAFFWSSWRPLCFLLALGAALWARRPMFWAPVVFLAAYNALHLTSRAAGVWLGYRWKTEVVGRLAALRIQRFFMPMALVGFAASLVLVGAGLRQDLAEPLALLWVAGFCGLIRLRISMEWLFLGAAGIGIAGIYLKGIL